MNKTITKLPTIIPSRQKAPGVKEFKALLNLVEEPSLLLETENFQVICGNKQFLQLTSFSPLDVNGAMFGKFLSTEIIPKLLSTSPLTFSLLRYKKPPIQVIGHLHILENTQQWMVLSVIPVEQQIADQNKNISTKDRLKSFYGLSQLVSQANLETALSLALDIGSSMVGSDALCIYHADSSTPHLRKFQNPSQTSVFPDTIPSIELIRLTSPTLWIPGNRITTGLQRIAQTKNFRYLASAPLGQPGAWSGLLVAASNSPPIDDDTLKLLEILAGQITAVLQHFILINHNTSTIQKINEVVPILRSVIDHTQDGVIVLNTDLTISEINPSAEQMLGYSNQEVVNQPVRNVLIGTETFTSVLNSAVQGIPTQNLASLNLHRRNGQAFPAQIQIIPVIMDDAIRKIVILFFDYSENEQARIHTQQLEQRAVLGEVTAIFAHEVRNPINNISTGLQLMSMNYQEDAPESQLINRLQGDCARLTSLMDSVLNFSKGTEYRLVPTDLKLLIERILERWRPRFSNAKVQSTLQMSIEKPLVSGDPRALEQVFTNLISNAVNAMTEKGGALVIKIGLEEPLMDPPQMKITVTDNGTGIPDEIRDRIFEPFVTTNKIHGTGLGLAITKRILVAHRGSIHVDSFPGGTVFTILLPLLAGDLE